MSNPSPGGGSTLAASAGSAMNDRARDITIRTVAAVLCASERSSASVSAHCCAPAVGEDPLGDARVGAGHPGGDRAHVVAAQGGGVEEAAQVVAGLGRPERGVFDSLAGDRERERVGPADRRRGVLAPVQRRPRERGGHAADELRVEHVDRAAERADRGGQGEHVGLGGRGDDRAGVAEDHVGQERGLAGSGRGHDQHVLLEGDAQAVPVVRPAEEHRVLGRGAGPAATGGGTGGSGASGAARRACPSAGAGRTASRSPCRGAGAGGGGPAGPGPGCRAGSGRAGTPTGSAGP